MSKRSSLGLERQSAFVTGARLANGVVVRAFMIFDTRWRFATIIRWYRAGLDPNREMIKLTTYLGHKHPSHTYWYMEAVPELMPPCVCTRRTSGGHGGWVMNANPFAICLQRFFTDHLTTGPSGEPQYHCELPGYLPPAAELRVRPASSHADGPDVR